ncbi:MAG: hypothetical protein HONDAALG_01354 [Gammaproteobacteria bacterium]|nr:hypothetical protein [Gammaproteobacteria bacterium]
MSEDRERITRAYKRAGLGLAAAALLWMAALLFTGEAEYGKATWLVPICAAALSVFCFSRYRKSKDS